MLFSIFGGGSVAIDSLFLLHPLSMGLCVYTSFCCPSSFALILMGNRELVALIVLLVSFDY